MDAYAGHLAKVNDSNDVIATDNICNAQGQILVKKGSAIDAATAARIARFKLQKPLEDSIVIENELTAETLFQHIEKFLTSDDCTAFLYQKFNQPERLRKACKLFAEQPLLRQKLTVLSLIMPNIFEQALFCAWFGFTLSRSLNSFMDSPENVFISAMCHDIGMVHIDVNILNKKSTLTAEEWKQIQAHPVISYNIVKSIKGISALITQAVLEHHENLDGTGYPRGITGAKLGHEGQLLNLLDSINAIYTKNFKPFNRTLADLIPIIQINQQSWHSDIAKQIILLLRESPKQKKHSIPPELTREVITVIKHRNNYILRCIEICSEIANEISSRDTDNNLANIQKTIAHITVSVTQSGIINSAYMQWLDQIVTEKINHALLEIEEAYVMMLELTYHLDRLKRQIKLFIELQHNHDFTQSLKLYIEQLEQVKIPQIADNLANVWIFKQSK
ncbi:MAG: HD domain-containing phosphohydrolase [Marinagarivorans sp.]|nr:HD domain-containing phosphohydrolase [Marinagarivorans sp.]